MEKSTQDPELPLPINFCSGEVLDRINANWYDQRDPYLGTGAVRDIQKPFHPPFASSATPSR